MVNNSPSPGKARNGIRLLVSADTSQEPARWLVSVPATQLVKEAFRLIQNDYNQTFRPPSPQQCYGISLLFAGQPYRVSGHNRVADVLRDNEEIIAHLRTRDPPPATPQLQAGGATAPVTGKKLAQGQKRAPTDEAAPQPQLAAKKAKVAQDKQAAVHAPAAGAHGGANKPSAEALSAPQQAKLKATAATAKATGPVRPATKAAPVVSDTGTAANASAPTGKGSHNKATPIAAAAPARKGSTTAKGTARPAQGNSAAPQPEHMKDAQANQDATESSDSDAEMAQAHTAPKAAAAKEAARAPSSSEEEQESDSSLTEASDHETDDSTDEQKKHLQQKSKPQAAGANASKQQPAANKHGAASNAKPKAQQQPVAKKSAVNGGGSMTAGNAQPQKLSEAINGLKTKKTATAAAVPAMQKATPSSDEEGSSRGDDAEDNEQVPPVTTGPLKAAVVSTLKQGKAIQSTASTASDSSEEDESSQSDDDDDDDSDDNDTAPAKAGDGNAATSSEASDDNSDGGDSDSDDSKADGLNLADIVAGTVGKSIQGAKGGAAPAPSKPAAGPAAAATSNDITKKDSGQGSRPRVAAEELTALVSKHAGDVGDSQQRRYYPPTVEALLKKLGGSKRQEAHAAILQLVRDVLALEHGKARKNISYKGDAPEWWPEGVTWDSNWNKKAGSTDQVYAAAYNRLRALCA